MATKKAEAAVELMTGRYTIDADFRPPIARDPLALVTKAMGLTSVELVETYKITSEQDKQEVFNLTQTAAKQILEIEKDYEEERALRYGLHKTLTTKMGQDLHPWEVIVKFGKKAIGDWNDEQERIKKAEDARIERENRARQEKADREAKAAQDSADAAAREAIKQGDLATARQIKDEGRARAQEIIEEAVPLEVVRPRASAPIKGLGESNPLVATVSDLMLFIKAVAEGKFPLMHTVKGESVPVVNVELSILTEMAKRLGGSGAPPGIEFTRKQQLRISTKGADPGPREPEPTSFNGWE